MSGFLEGLVAIDMRLLAGGTHDGNFYQPTVLADVRPGMVHINDQTINDDGTNPFGGPGIAGNGNAHGGPGDWVTFSTWQWVTV